jgi:hypothetical protein
MLKYCVTVPSLCFLTYLKYAKEAQYALREAH